MFTALTSSKALLCALLVSITLSLGVISNSHSQQASDSTTTDADIEKKLDAIRLKLLTGGKADFEAVSLELESLAKVELSQDNRETWVRLSREAAIRLADRSKLESLKSFEDPFESQIIYRVLLAMGELEKSEFAKATATLDSLGDLEKVNEREKRRVYALRARIAQMEQKPEVERVYIEKIVDHLHEWSTAKCQSCHNMPSQPDVVTTLPIERFWFGDRFVELMKSQGDAEKVRADAEANLKKNGEDNQARIRLAYALLALGDEKRAKQLFSEIPWMEMAGKEIKKARMMTVFP